MKLFVSITPHGFGHAAQTIPVINALTERTQCDVTIQSDLPNHFLNERLRQPFQHLQSIGDFGMIMHDPMQVNISASHHQYLEVAEQWEMLVSKQMTQIEQSAPDVVISNVSFISCVAASRLGIPCIALSSLNWYDIYSQICQSMPDAQRVGELMQSAYLAADKFFRLTPSMAMPWMTNSELVPPIVEQSINKTTVPQLDSNYNWALIAFGGIPFDQDPTKWQLPDDWATIVPPALASLEHRRYPTTDFDCGFPELLQAVDVVITKPGYGTFVNTAYHSTPILYLPREQWPESPALIDWVSCHAVAKCMPADAMTSGWLVGNMNSVLDEAIPNSFAIGGEHSIANTILSI